MPSRALAPTPSRPINIPLQTGVTSTVLLVNDGADGTMTNVEQGMS
jgi:hypothetical protein